MKLGDIRESLIVEMPVGRAYKGRWYYHGTKGENGEKILSDGFLKVPDHGKKKSSLTPMKGKVYLTTDFPEALTNAVGANVRGMILGKMKGHKYYGHDRTCAIVRVDGDYLSESYDVDEDNLAEFFFLWYHVDPQNDEEKAKKKLAQEIAVRYISGDKVQAERLRKLRSDPAFHIGVQVAKSVLKKMKKGVPEHDYFRRRLEAYAINMAHVGDVPVESVMFFKPSDFEKIPEDQLDKESIYTWDIMAKHIGKIEKPPTRSRS